jgi:hypothetical protein
MVLSPDEEEVPFTQRTKRHLAREMSIAEPTNTTPVTRLRHGLKNLRTRTARNKMSPRHTTTSVSSLAEIHGLLILI